MLYGGTYHHDEGDVHGVGGVRQVVAAGPVQGPLEGDGGVEVPEVGGGREEEALVRGEPALGCCSATSPGVERGPVPPGQAPDDADDAAHEEAPGQDRVEREHVAHAEGAVLDGRGVDEHGVGADEVLGVLLGISILPGPGKEADLAWVGAG